MDHTHKEETNVCYDLPGCWQPPSHFGAQAAFMGSTPVPTTVVDDELLELVEQDEVPLILFEDKVGNLDAEAAMKWFRWQWFQTRLRASQRQKSHHLQRHRPFPWMASSLARQWIWMALLYAGYHSTAHGEAVSPLGSVVMPWSASFKPQTTA